MDRLGLVSQLTPAKTSLIFEYVNPETRKLGPAPDQKLVSSLPSTLPQDQIFILSNQPSEMEGNQPRLQSQKIQYIMISPIIPGTEIPLHYFRVIPSLYMPDYPKCGRPQPFLLADTDEQPSDNQPLSDKESFLNDFQLIPLFMKASNGKVVGYRSGVRSALCQFPLDYIPTPRNLNFADVKSRFIRYKGCGNDNYGFSFTILNPREITVPKGANAMVDSQEEPLETKYATLRGGMFWSTISRELRFTDIIDVRS